MKCLFFFIAVGLAIVQTGLAQKNNPIVVASYNIRYENPNDGENSWANRKEHVKALIQFHEFDIFGIQEGVFNQVKDIAALEQYSYCGHGRDDGKQAGEHSAIFYKKDRFKLLKTGDFWLSETPEKPSLGWDAPNCKRICSWGKLLDMQSKKQFYFFCVHFDHQGKEARRQSGYLMVGKIKEIAGNFPVICVGDFNSTPETEQIVTMQTLLNDAYKVTELPPYGPEKTSSGFGYDPVRERRMDSIFVQLPKKPGILAGTGPRIDYIFVSNQVKVLKYGVLTDYYGKMSYPSDHFPVMVKIEFK